jgi:predicted  nucleic acid-binding Zn-ribbon protein
VTTTLAQIERLLSDWRQKVATANQNLLDLYDLPAYQRVAGMGNPPTSLTGITQQRVSKALIAIDCLFEDLELLTGTIDLARKMRQELPAIFISDDRLQEIYQLMMGESIQLPSIETPLAQRDLLSSTRQLQQISPTALLDRMMSAFTIARDIFINLETAWNELESKLIITHQTLLELQQQAQQLQIPTSSALTLAQTNFSNLQAQIDRDPFGVSQTIIVDLTPLINNTRRELEHLAKQRQDLQTAFVTAHQQLEQLQALDRSAILAYTESQAKIGHNLPMMSSLPAEELTALAQWLERLEEKYRSGIILPIQVGLTNWTSRIEAYTIAATAALTANRRPLDTRNELRGRLDALTAKALGKGRAEDPILANLAIQARQVLYSSPTDLNLGRDLVRQYEQRLNSGS